MDQKIGMWLAERRGSLVELLDDTRSSHLAGRRLDHEIAMWLGGGWTRK